MESPPGSPPKNVSQGESSTESPESPGWPVVYSVSQWFTLCPSGLPMVFQWFTPVVYSPSYAVSQPLAVFF